jgi:Tol biopolymer transport system component
MNCAGGEKRLVQSEGAVSDAVFSPDGRWIYFTRVNTDRTTDIMRVSAQGTVAEPVVAWAGSSEKNPTLAAKGSLMAFASNREGKFHIYLSDGEGSDPLQLANLEADHSRPTFSPDATLLTYLSDRQGFAGKADVWLYNRKSGRQTQLTRNAHVLDYCWLDDSRTIVYSAGINLSDYNALDIMEGSIRKFLPLDTIKDYTERAAQIVADTSGTRRIIYTRHYQTGKQEIHMVHQNGSNDTRVVNGITEDWLD